MFVLDFKNNFLAILFNQDNNKVVDWVSLRSRSINDIWFLPVTDISDSIRQYNWVLPRAETWIWWEKIVVLRTRIRPILRKVQEEHTWRVERRQPRTVAWRKTMVHKTILVVLRNSVANGSNTHNNIVE